ncbi:DUF1858 domain-containing protein [Consotaella salsifontis]|uniref:Hybrid cluster protein-associated redox disulfide domain-containing protein n=1 Tax=Consotaella salsifontis TaxID=1365950 RepID=A0A1T4NIL6_9HYPH|nr:DUF1858 domain-containing protein [Consotaella salsifontis]SJZ79140.1 hybrid cluster protein-associated redox disulfide domain-containing protein [Consotaella salsifontis]
MSQVLSDPNGTAPMAMLFAPITDATVVDELMSRHRAAIPVFLCHRMHCVGCPVGRIHTLKDACREHGIGLSQFIASLNDAIGAAEQVRDDSINDYPNQAPAP